MANETTTEATRLARKTRTGVVVSDKMQKTVTVTLTQQSGNDWLIAMKNPSSTKISRIATKMPAMASAVRPF